jgi:hypothetical protein
MAQSMSFSTDEVQILEEERILLPASSGISGKRKISGSFFTPPASHGSISSSGSGSTASVSFKHYALDLNSNLEIPLAEESPEAWNSSASPQKLHRRFTTIFATALKTSPSTTISSNGPMRTQIPSTCQHYRQHYPVSPPTKH